MPGENMTELIDRLELRHRPVVTAPDGSKIRELCRVKGGSVAHCTLTAGLVTYAVKHRTVEEIWFVLAGVGKLWQRDEQGREEVIDLSPGLCVTVPLGHAFQFRADAHTNLEMLLATCPPWPSGIEADELIGPWSPTAT